MVYRRSKTSKRRPRRRIARPMRSLRMVSPTSVFAVRQKTFLETWQFSSASTVGFWRYFTTQLQQMTSFAQHVAVFDEFKVVNITYEFRPQWDNFSPDNSLWSSGSVHTIIDPASGTTPAGAYSSATVNTFLEQGGVKSRRFGTVVRCSYKPKVATQVYGGGLNGRIISAPWLKTNDTAVDFRGFHIYLQQNDSTLLPVKYDVFMTMTVHFRGHK